MKLLNPAFEAYVIPITLAIIVGLFAIQRFGTGVVGGLFGPVMLIWFIVIGVVGTTQVVGNPVVLQAVSPTYAISFLLANPIQAFFTIGTVVLAVTGAEALYVDMGHFGRPAISRAWLLLALPALLLCYAGQSALVLGFRSSSALAAAFGLAVTATMVLTTLIIGS